MDISTLGDLVFSIMVIVLLTWNRISTALLRDRIAALEKKLGIQAKQCKESSHNPFPFNDDPSSNDT